MFALISSTESVSYLSSWDDQTPIYTTIPDASRVAEVAAAEFPVYQTLFWVDCADDVVADQFYYDSVTQQILPVPAPAPKPEPVQPTTTGTQEI